jgi:SAM-dependent methyltransferase
MNQEKVIKKLEIGSGSRPRDGYIHHDIRQLDGIDVVCDARKFPEELYGSFDEVYASHVLEHFNRFEVKAVLQEWIKLLRPDGKIDIVVPDVREICRQFVEGFIDIEFFDYLMFGGNDYEYNVHKYGFDATHLEKTLNSLGMEIVSSIEGVKWEKRKKDKYCPMVRVVAKKV